MKGDFYIDRVDKESSKNLLYNYHYLKDESKDFKSGCQIRPPAERLTGYLILGMVARYH